MAYIKKKINRIEKERNYVHSTVDATYSSFSDKEGNIYFQIDTYGSSERKFQGKISQSLQIDKNTAIELIELLKYEFKIDQ